MQTGLNFEEMEIFYYTRLEWGTVGHWGHPEFSYSPATAIACAISKANMRLSGISFFTIRPTKEMQPFEKYRYIYNTVHIYLRTDQKQVFIEKFEC